MSRETYFDNDGKDMDLILVKANLSNGSDIQNLGVEMYLPRDFPRSLPITFVFAPFGFRFNAVDYMDSNGRINMTYFSQSINILDLLRSLSYVFFSRAPPICSRIDERRMMLEETLQKEVPCDSYSYDSFSLLKFIVECMECSLECFLRALTS